MLVDQSQVEVNYPQQFEPFATSNFPIPKDLIAVLSYWKWQQRCGEFGYEVHGHDLEDWFEAENEIQSQISEFTLKDVEIFVSRVLSKELTPSVDRVRTRAFFLSENADSDSGQPDQSRTFWLQAEAQERAILFSQLFMDFWSRRRLMSVFPS